MDESLRVNDTLREGELGGLAETPLVTIAWRALRAQLLRRADERRSDEAEAKLIRDALANIAEEAHRLRCAIRLARNSLDEAGLQTLAQQLLAIADRTGEALVNVGVATLDPEGQPFTSTLMELFHNIAQQPVPGAGGPRVAEVITPAVTFRGTVLRMGRAVIAVPTIEESVVKTDSI